MKVSTIALSGMNAAMTQLASAAHNVANTQTPGFRRQLVQQETLPQGGTQTRLATAPEEGGELSTDLIQERQALHVFTANLRMVQTEHEMLGSLLNVRA